MITHAVADPFIDSVVLILTGFGLVILLLSGFLVVNAISALITQQIPQIGVMKLIGARRWQIMRLYLATVLIYGLIAVAFALPLAALTARLLMTDLVERLLNVMPKSYDIPLQLLLVQVAVGLLLPLGAGLLPGDPWHERDHPARLERRRPGRRHGRPQRLRAWLARLQRGGLDPAAALACHPQHPASQGTAGADPGRADLRHCAVHFGAQRARVGRRHPGQFLHALPPLRRVRADGAARAGRALEQAASEVPGVAEVEVWSSGRATRVRADDSKSSLFNVVAVPAGTTFMDPEMVAGRWLPAAQAPASSAGGKRSTVPNARERL